jgi:hypothetical protein
VDIAAEKGHSALAELMRFPGVHSELLKNKDRID